ncbi:hypothetical protein HDU79_007851 [Rhizoclosmatium sp. JEL0117]|nr:hypothetical protein HDU79_007851 [Rhizoclosmatium sp. JEL0117]
MLQNRSRSATRARKATAPAAPEKYLFSLSLSELAEFDGRDPEKPIYLSLKGMIYDVSHRRDLYAPGGQMNEFAGKDVTRAFSMSSMGSRNKLKPTDFNADFQVMSDEQRETLENWVAFYDAAYKVVGTIRKE